MGPIEIFDVKTQTYQIVDLCDIPISLNLFNLWYLIMNHLHPYWVSSGQIETEQLFVQGQSVSVDFGEQFGIDDPIAVLNEIEKEIKLGLTTQKRALMKKNKGMTEAEADDLLKEIEEESTVEVSDVDENENKDTETLETGREGSTSA